MERSFTVREVAEWIHGAVEGNADVELRRVAPFDTAGPGDLTFAADPKRAARLPESRAGAALVGPDAPAASVPLIRVENVQAALAAVLARLAPPDDAPPSGVDPTAAVAADAEVASDAAIGPGAVVGAGAKLGAGAVLYARAVVGPRAEIGPASRLLEGAVVRADCVVGARCIIGPNSVVGADGFGYYTQGGVHHKVPHVGTVILEDDVELGACACVDRAKFGATRVGAGTKIDNLVQVAHNVQLGHGCLLAGHTGIAGSAKLGDYVVTGGHAGVRDNISLGNGVTLAAFCAVAQDVPDGEIMGGIPATRGRDHLRVIKSWAKLPDLLKRVRELEAKLSERESSEDRQ